MLPKEEKNLSINCQEICQNRMKSDPLKVAIYTALNLITIVHQHPFKYIGLYGYQVVTLRPMAKL